MQKIIINIVGDFAVGKDTLADILLCKMKKQNYDVTKILSKTTRKPRHPNENTHTFTERLEYQIDAMNGLMVAHTTINNEEYWTSKNQFNKDYNIYVTDTKGTIDLQKTPYIIFKIHITRKTEKNNRTTRHRTTPLHTNLKYNYTYDNNGTIEDLTQEADKIIKAIQKYKTDLQKIYNKQYS